MGSGTIDTMLISSMTELNEFVLNLTLLAKELQTRCILTRFQFYIISETPSDKPFLMANPL